MHGTNQRFLYFICKCRRQQKNVVYGGFCFVLRALDITQKSHNVRNLLVLRHTHIVLWMQTEVFQFKLFLLGHPTCEVLPHGNVRGAGATSGGGFDRRRIRGGCVAHRFGRPHVLRVVHMRPVLLVIRSRGRQWVVEQIGTTNGRQTDWMVWELNKNTHTGYDRIE